MVYSLNELENIISGGIDEVHNDVTIREKVVKYHTYLYHSQGCKCKISNVTINQMFEKLKTDGLPKMEEIENRKFHLRDNVIPLRIKGLNVDNVNLTDEMAMEILKENDKRISLFKSKPDDWQVMVSEFFAKPVRTKKRKMKRRKPRTKKTDTTPTNTDNEK
ncbi:hypothetical protein [Galbibacter orientalis]|uniref:hypothetical protein n=1 Tax=Galbibacter orientalis TaxID=453852 RepID=UPI00308033D0